MVELGTTKKLSEGTFVPPFPAIVGQAELKEALLVTAVNDAIDGLLIRGEKGTAKSTTARALAALLPDQRAIADCPFGCPPDDPTTQCSNCRARTDPPVETRSVPFVTLPLGATRERVTGTLSVADALAGSAEFDPGLLARANRGILYVDEVNLLEDHLVDVLLDAAASGVNRVERDGVSVTHPAAFTLVGTMNPEEGELRPQFRDRFALQVTVSGSDDLDERATVVERTLAGFDEGYTDETAAVRERLLAARDRLPAVTIPDSLLTDLVERCRDLEVEGHRGDIATARTARTLAALAGRERVIEPDVSQAAAYALPHRLNRRPFEETSDPRERIEDQFGEESAEESPTDDGDSEEGEGSPEDPQSGGDEHPDSPGAETDGQGAENPEQSADAGADGHADSPGAESDEPRPENGEQSAGAESQDDGASGSPDEAATPLLPGQSRADIGTASAPELTPETADGPASERGGSRAPATPTTGGSGPRVRTEPADRDGPVDASASVRAAATRGSDTVESRDLRRSVRATTRSALVVFALDGSASMRGPMRAAKGVVMELLQDAYEQRDEVSVVAFAGDDAEVLLPPTDSVSLAARHLKELPTADRTPLAAGIETVADVLERADPAVGVVVLVTDGRANGGSGSPTAATRQAADRLAGQGAHVVVVDAGNADGPSLTEVIETRTEGVRVPLEALSAERIDAAVASAARTDEQ